MPSEKPCHSKDHVQPGDRVRLHNTHSLAGHGLFIVDKVAAEGVHVHDAQGKKHVVNFQHVDCVMGDD